MQITAKVVSILPVVNGTSKSGKDWKSQIIVLETEDKYPKKIAVSLWNDNIQKYTVTPYTRVTVDVEPESREYNGRWYTELKAFKIESVGTVPVAQNLANTPSPDESLPF
jgi:hypothetical protein